jgi:hypothetical protein
MNMGTGPNLFTQRGFTSRTALRGAHELRTDEQKMTKNCSIWEHLKYPVLKIFYDVEHLQKSRLLASKLLFIN